MWTRTRINRCLGSILVLAATRPSLRSPYSSGAWQSFVVAAESTRSATSNYRTLKVQIIHRHGDRSPITPMKDVEYWSSQLIDETTLEKIAENTNKP